MRSPVLPKSRWPRLRTSAHAGLSFWQPVLACEWCPSTPKGLLEVNGEPLIERAIRQLQEVGIREIYVVVGFLKERYEYLIDEFGVELIVNPDYVGKNNLYSLKLALPHLANYSMGQQMTGKADFIAMYNETGDLYGMIVSILKTLPCAPLVMAVVLVTMIAFYATSFDSIALTASCYSYHTLKDGEQPHKGIQLLWCILLILLPIALLFAESSMNNLQSVSIVAAFPIGAVIVLIVASFLKDAKNYMQTQKPEL